MTEPLQRLEFSLGNEFLLGDLCLVIKLVRLKVRASALIRSLGVSPALQESQEEKPHTSSGSSASHCPEPPSPQAWL